MFCIGPLCDFDDSFVVSLAPFKLLFRDDDIVDESVFGCDEIGKVAIYAQAAYETVFVALYDFNDLCLFNVLLSACHEAHFHAIAIGCPHGIAL